MPEKPWNGRFSEKTDRLVEAFTASVDFDKRLYAHDIEGSIAHCKMLVKTGLLEAEEADALVEGLRAIRREIPAENQTRVLPGQNRVVEMWGNNAVWPYISLPLFSYSIRWIHHQAAWYPRIL